MIEEDAHKGVCVYEETIAARDKPRLIDAGALLKKLDELYSSIDQDTSQDIAQAWGVAQATGIINEMLAEKQEKADG